MEVKNSSITVMVSDFSKSIDFYTNTLGLTLKARYGDNYAEITAPGLTIGLHPAGEHKLTETDAVSIGFEVSDIQAAKLELEAKGVQFPEGVRDNRQLLIANFTDLDGTHLNIVQMKPRG